MNDELKYNNMICELKKNGCEINPDNLVHSNFSHSDNEILLRYIGMFEKENYNELVISCLRQPRRCYLSSYLVQEFIYTNIKKESYRWCIAEALYTISNQEMWQAYIDIAANKEYGKSRQMIVMLLGKIKCTEAIDFLLRSIIENDYDILTQALWSIEKLKNYDICYRIYDYMINLTSEHGKKVYISNMCKLKKDNPEYQYTDIDGFWKSIQKEANKILRMINTNISENL